MRPPIAYAPLLITFSLTASVALGGCGKEPMLNVQQQSAAPTAAPAAVAEPSATEPASTQPVAPGEPVAAHAAGTPTALPAGHPPLDAAAQGAMQLAPVAPEHGQGATALSWRAPATWVAEPPSNSMRRAQYRVPGPGGEGECVVFYFGPGQGGDAPSNAERWASQFADASGQPATASMKTRTASINGMQVLFVEAAGTYQSGSMMGMGQVVAKPDWALLGAIAAGPDSNWFFKFTAPKATIEANRVAFEKMIAALERGG
jgi:hypothetical protein